MGRSFALTQGRAVGQVFWALKANGLREEEIQEISKTITHIKVTRLSIMPSHVE